MSVNEFFQELDTGFLNFDDKGQNPPLLFKSTDCHLQTEFVLPVPVLAGSTVRYQFSTSGGDVQFGTRFVSSAGAEEDVLQASRVPSDAEPVSGQFKALREGTLFLRFDNSFSWFTSKLLSYRVELYQPAFTLADTSRCMKSRSLLRTTVGDTRRAEEALQGAQQALGALGQEIPGLETRLAALQAELEAKRLHLHRACGEAEQLSARIEANLDKRNGLCLR